jgi:hypothetical protein
MLAPAHHAHAGREQRAVRVLAVAAQVEIESKIEAKLKAIHYISVSSA